MKGVTRHASMEFDVPFISKIADNLWQGGCEDGLVLPPFIKHVVSLYPWEAYTLATMPDTYLEVVMYDSEDQGYDQVDEIAQWINKRRKEGVVLVHCQAGLNRSSLVAARALTLDGMTGVEAINLLREKRSPACLCNPAFYRYIKAIGKENS
jgi:protein-tyrosine phosphatase